MAQQHAERLEGDLQADQKPAVAQEKGPGVQAMEALLAKGKPTAKQVVALVDTYRGERDALFALLHKSLGNEFVQQVVGEMDGLRASLDRKEVAAGDPSDPNGGYFLASAKEQGARWRTADGDFSGKANKDGLDATYRLDEDDALHGKVDKKGAGTLAWERDGKTMGELYGGPNDGGFHAGVRKPWELGTGSLSTGLEYRKTDAGGFAGAVGSYKATDGSLALDGRAGVMDGGFAGSLSGTYKPNEHDTFKGKLSHDPSKTALSLSGSHKYDGGTISGSGEIAHSDKGTTGSIGAGWTDGTTSLDGKYTRGLESDKFHLGGSHKFSDQLSMTGSLGHERRFDGTDQTTLSLAERYRSDRVAQSLSLDAGLGDKKYLGVTGSYDAQIGNGLYAGAWGSFRAEEGKQTSAQLGASLTFTPHEKAALTLAGVMDQDGALETRLQLDVFKSRINGLSTIADSKKDALVSLFLSYSQPGRNGMVNGMMDSRYGAPQMQYGAPGGDGQFMAGIRIKF